ncbi:MAG: phosphotransferase [Solobacterium sp.]|nr:phosphotransferase [Solobacterium sp.]
MYHSETDIEKLHLSFDRDNDCLTIRPAGRIESSNAMETETAIKPELHDISSVVLDCTDLEYISSAGLRIVLRIKKTYDDLKAVNVSSEVYDVFQVTGFSEMMDVEKAYRTLSVEGCEVIGQGANGIVYRYDEDTIVKVFRNPDALDEIKRERELARTAFVLGVPTAISYDIVKVEGGLYGSVFELLNADTFQHLLISGQKSVEEIVTMIVDLMKIVHSTQPKSGALPSRLDIMRQRMPLIKPLLPEDAFARLEQLVNTIPENGHMLHGDFHVKNVMIQNGESILIDMDTLCVGDPIFEFSGIYLPYVGFSEMDPEDSMRFFNIPLETSHRLFYDSLREYFKGCSLSFEEALIRTRILAYSRLLFYCAIGKHTKPEELEKRKAHAVKNLLELLPQTESLSADITY